MTGHPPNSPLFPYPPLSRSARARQPATTRRSADEEVGTRTAHSVGSRPRKPAARARRLGRVFQRPAADRKSTRLNSSHANISYAVFCLKKKKTKKKNRDRSN